MITAADLREALEVWRIEDPLRNDGMLLAIIDATRTIALPILEADPELVEKVAHTFHETYERLAPSFGYETRIETRTAWPPPNADLVRAVVRDVLAAISTPTPGAD